MKRDPHDTSLYSRFMDWADEDSAPSAAEEAESTEFMEYLEYLDVHEYIDFATYHKLMAGEDHAAAHPPQTSSEEDAQRPRHHLHHPPGWLRRWLRLYGVLSILIAVVLTGTMLLVAVTLPPFGASSAPAVNEVSGRYLEQGLEETGAVNAVAGMILDYRAFDTFGESTVLFAATMSVVLLLRRPDELKSRNVPNHILITTGRFLLPFVMMYGIYVILNGHLSPGGGFSGGTVLGCGLILAALVLGDARMETLMPAKRMTRLTVICLLLYGLMKGYSFFTGANHVGWEIPKGTPGAILSSGFILPLNICVGIIVACTMYTFYTLFAEKEV